jgi:redox-sensitive bicupin YhaK (pirin superfamily)
LVLGLSVLVGSTVCGAFTPPLSTVRKVHTELGALEDETCIDKVASRMAAKTVAKVVRKVIPAPRPHWVGNGFHVYPVFGELAFTEELSPWLMFDYAAPKTFEASNTRRGVGQHPHRGFETITIAFQGEVEHGDSVGNRDVIGPGDVQWMTAARGIIHEEFHSDKFTAKGGVFEMCQLWLNLPAKHKMDPPRYQPILASQIPSVPLGDGDNSEDGFVRVIAGEFKGVKGPAKTFTPVSLWNIEIAALNKPFDLELGDGHNCVVFVRSGRASVGGAGAEKDLGPAATALMHKQGTRLCVTAKEADTKLLVLAGEPINEPIAAQGPFVMNTHEEIRQANIDFRSGRMGR